LLCGSFFAFCRLQDPPIFDLVGFIAAVMTIADHLPALMLLVARFGALLLRFRL
jgi:hypothetical protein